MWLPWGNSGRRRFKPDPSLSFSTFKDVLTLCRTDDPPRKTTVFRRTDSSPFRLSSSLARRNSLPVSFPATVQEGDSPLPETSSSKGGEKTIVLYFTSLRVVRKTFEDCRSVQSILKGFRVPIDERDLSMDTGFLRELELILGRRLSLPRVFIGGRYVGGADEIMQLHESGELKLQLEGLPSAGPVCEFCGGVRFILCGECDGSHKCYTEKGGFRSCSTCNENGLTGCPDCYS